MKILDTKFEEGGFTYTQVSRDGDVAVYEKRWTGIKDASVCYEVIIIHRHEGLWVRGKYYAPAEIYPSNAKWGHLGWTSTTRQRALQKALEVAALAGSPDASEPKTAVLAHQEHQHAC